MFGMIVAGALLGALLSQDHGLGLFWGAIAGMVIWALGRTIQSNKSDQTHNRNKTRLNRRH